MTLTKNEYKEYKKQLKAHMNYLNREERESHKPVNTSKYMSSLTNKYGKPYYPENNIGNVFNKRKPKKVTVRNRFGNTLKIKGTDQNENSIEQILNGMKNKLTILEESVTPKSKRLEESVTPKSKNAWLTYKPPPYIPTHTNYESKDSISGQSTNPVSTHISKTPSNFSRLSGSTTPGSTTPGSNLSGSNFSNSQSQGGYRKSRRKPRRNPRRNCHRTSLRKPRKKSYKKSNK